MKYILAFLLSIYSAFGADFYTALDYTQNQVVSDTGFYNKAEAYAPGIAMGWQWTSWSVEAFWRQSNLENTHIEQGALFNIELNTTQYGIGGRYRLLSWLDSKFGALAQRVKASYTTSSSLTLSQLINDTYYAYYAGLGIYYDFNDRWTTFLNLSYYAGDNIYSVLGYEAGIRYVFSSLF
ncbi:MAG: hypothetical protein H6622_06395 [Halobacteriovoraceae bacterium]|nr:hypothetical protein [Halobacteriovoraceae bacterium]